MNSSPSEYCHSIIQNVSRTFAIGIERMDDPLSDYVCVSYLLCRIPDTIEDASHLSPSTKQSLLDQYAGLLKPDSTMDDVNQFVARARGFKKSNDYWNLISHSDKVWTLWEKFPPPVKELTRPHVLEMVDGMKNVVGTHPDGIRIHSMEDFQQYCYYVAGTVGNLLTGLFQHTDDLSQPITEKLFDHAEDFGEALQTVNIVKDVYADYHQENTIYLPQELLSEHGGSHATLFERTRATQEVLNELIQHARQKLQLARRYISILPIEARQPREFCIIPYLLAVSTLREASRRREDILTETPVKISREEVQGILLHLPQCIEDDEYLASFAERARRQTVQPSPSSSGTSEIAETANQRQSE